MMTATMTHFDRADPDAAGREYAGCHASGHDHRSLVTGEFGWGRRVARSMDLCRRECHGRAEENLGAEESEGCGGRGGNGNLILPGGTVEFPCLRYGPTPAGPT
jgi:hypothetical protein